MTARSILFLTNTSEFFLSHRLPLARRLTELGWRVTIVTDDSDYSERLHAEGFVVHRTRFRRKSPGLLTEVANLFRIAAIIRKTRPDIVHNVALKAAVFGSLATRLASRARIVNAITGLGVSFVAGSGDATFRRRLLLGLMRVALRSRHCYTIVQNPDDLEFLAGLDIIEPDNARLIFGSGVDPAEYVAADAPRAGETVSVVLAARLLWSKGVAEFVNAADRLATRYPDVEFLIAGKVDSANPDHVPVSDLTTFSRRPNVEWTGFIDDMVSFLGDASIVVLPSSYREGVPKVLIEAAMVGRPIVTTDLPGCREAVIDGETGLLVPAHDGKALADALGVLLDEPDMRARFGRAAREFAKQKFSLETVLSETLRVYDEVLATTPGRNP